MVPRVPTRLVVRVVLALAFVSGSAPLRAEPCGKVSFILKASDDGPHPEITLERVTILFDKPACSTALKEHEKFTLQAGALVVSGELPAPNLTFGAPFVDVRGLALDRSSFLLADVMPFPDAGRVTIGSHDFEVSVEGDYFALQRDRSAHSFALGPAQRGDDASVPATEGDNALRLQFTYEYAAALGKKGKSLLSTALALDTTDRGGEHFIDDNSLALKYRSADWSAGDLIRRLRFTGEVEYARAFHSRAETLDTLAGIELRVPLVQSVSLFPRGTSRFLAPPLSLDLAYGYRHWDTPDRPSEQGGVFKGMGKYSLFLFGRYRLAMEYHYAHTDLTDADPAVPATQRLYRGTLSFLANDRFSVQTSYEDGSIGPVLTKVKQYFLGVAFSDGF